MSNWIGWIRERWGTIRTASALVHPHLVRVRLSGQQNFHRYARPVFERYLQSLAPHVPIISYSRMLAMLAIPPTDIQITLPQLNGYVGLSDWERVTVATLARCYRKYPAFEIGTAAGSTTLLLALNTSRTVHTLDLPSDGADNDFALPRLDSDDQVIAGRKRASMIAQSASPAVTQRIKTLVGDSATFDYRDYHEQIGLFFVDGAHSYEYVCSDTANAAACCRTDGIVVWHDFGSSRDVTRWIDELAAADLAVYGIDGTTLAFSTDINGLRKMNRRRAA